MTVLTGCTYSPMRSETPMVTQAGFFEKSKSSLIQPSSGFGALSSKETVVPRMIFSMLR